MPILAVGLVEHWHVRLNAVLVDQPVEHLGRAKGTVAREARRVEIEALLGAPDHPLGVGDFRLADGGGRLDINDDRVVEIDKVVG